MYLNFCFRASQNAISILFFPRRNFPCARAHHVSESVHSLFDREGAEQLAQHGKNHGDNHGEDGPTELLKRRRRLVNRNLGGQLRRRWRRRGRSRFRSLALAPCARTRRRARRCSLARAVYERGTCVEVVFRFVSEMARRGLVWYVLVC